MARTRDSVAHAHVWRALRMGSDKSTSVVGTFVPAYPENVRLPGVVSTGRRNTLS